MAVSSDHLLIAKRLKTKIFLVHPYASWEKGCIEYHNKLILQYIPKGTGFSNLSDSFIRKIQHKINRRPHKKLNFISPKGVFFKLITNFALAS